MYLITGHCGQPSCLWPIFLRLDYSLHPDDYRQRHWQRSGHHCGPQITQHEKGVVFAVALITISCCLYSSVFSVFKVNNILIVNLAISDLLLCTIFSPLTLIEVLHKRWIGPKAQWLCHLSAMGPVCITFVSTLTITGIAIDRWFVYYNKRVFLDVSNSITIFFFFRYKVIVYSANNRTPQKASTAFMTVLAIWTLSILLSFPLFFGTNLEVIQMPESVVRMIHDDSIAYCAEKWGEYEKGRLVYSCFILVMQVCQKFQNKNCYCIHMRISKFQFILPIVLISWAHHAIKQKLQKLPSWSISSKNNSNSIRRLSCKPEESNLGKYAPQALEESQNGISRLSKLRESVMKGKSSQRRQSNVSTKVFS